MTPEVFSILQTLCRIGLASENLAFRKQVERLKDSLSSEGALIESKTIEKLLKAAARSMAIQPSRIAISPAFVQGTEILLPQVTPPVDRETGSPLAELIFPNLVETEFPVLDDRIADAINSVIEEWQHQDRLKEANVSPTMTCLLYGKPGTGKTNISLAIGQKLGLPVVLARLDGVISSFLGTTGRNVANLFAFANRYNCILLLDEFDAVAKLRDDPHEVGEIKRVVNALLQNIDLRREKGITIAVTNHEQLLDSAVWRRFDVRIAIPTPTFAERVKIVKRYFADEDLDDSSAKFVAWLTEGMTGADIQTMARNVRRHRALNPESTFISTLKNYSITQAGRENLRLHSALEYPLPRLAREIISSPELSFTQKQVGTILSISQSQIGRWLKEEI